MRQQRIEEEAVADAAEREYQVVACCCKLQMQYIAIGHKLSMDHCMIFCSRVLAHQTSVAVQAPAGKEGQAG